ncbi:uncharacterized protein [Bemisia tabaci]|uniref:uncharacterized protein n=1 Tax=Bemisia tabaci TaxID=7038 RepID=UPI003B289B51
MTSPGCKRCFETMSSMNPLKILTSFIHLHTSFIPVSHPLYLKLILTSFFSPLRQLLTCVASSTSLIALTPPIIINTLTYNSTLTSISNSNNNNNNNNDDNSSVKMQPHHILPIIGSHFHVWVGDPAPRPIVINIMGPDHMEESTLRRLGEEISSWISRRSAPVTKENISGGYLLTKEGGVFALKYWPTDGEISLSLVFMGG